MLGRCYLTYFQNVLIDMNSRNLWRSSLLVVLIAALCGAMAVPMIVAPVQAAPRMQAGTNIVISQVYGGGGNSGTTYINDFIELFNPTNTTLSLDGWSIQYANATGTTWQITALSGPLDPGKYYLIQEAAGSGGTLNLPTPDATGSIPMGANAGKVALVNTTTPLNGSGCPFGGNIVDFVGYGTGGSGADCREGTTVADNAPTLNNTTAALRIGDGCFDANNNNADFVTASPNPRNTSSPVVICGDVFTSTAAANLTGTAAVDLTSTAGSNLTGTAISNATGTAIANLTNSPVPTSTPAGFMSVIINEVAWAGTAASSSDEWLELYNPNAFPIDISNWRIVIVDGSPAQITIPSGTILGADSYFLLERAQSATDIPADYVYGGTNLSNNPTGEILQLRDSNNVLVDTANSNGGAWPAGSSTTFGSMERRAGMLDSDVAWITNTGVVRNGLAANGTPINGTPKNLNWSFSVTPTASATPTSTRTPTRVPTQTLAPTLPPTPLVAINEFVARPGRDWNGDGEINTGDEYIEIINHGTVSANLNGYTLDDELNVGSDPYKLPSITLQPGQRIVFYGSETGLLLSDGGDAVRLLRPNGQVVDAYNYNVVNYPDQSYCRLPDNGGLDDWNVNCYPTPGLRNSLGGSSGRPTGGNAEESLCPIADTLPLAFYLAECDPFGNHIWSRLYWDDTGWYGEKTLPNVDGRWDVFVD